MFDNLDNITPDFRNLMNHVIPENSSVVPVNEYLFGQLGIDASQKTDDEKETFVKNFIYSICQVVSDLKISEDRIETYKKERTKLENVKSNEAEYRRRRLEYFAKLNKKAQYEIISFLRDDLASYLSEIGYDMLKAQMNQDELQQHFINERYSFAQYSDYYDEGFDYSTLVKMSQLPGIELKDRAKFERRYLDLHKNNSEEYNREIKRLIGQNKIVERLQKCVDETYHLNKRHEIFSDLIKLYREKHYQSFLVLGLLQLEGLFYDICSIRYEDKENLGTLVEKADKAFRMAGNVNYMRYYPYFAFDVPVMRNEIAHKGLMSEKDLERKADELILDLYAVEQMAKMESDGKFRIFSMIFDEIKPIDDSTDEAINKKLVIELCKKDIIAPDSFWSLLRNPENYEDEIEFYRQENLADGYVDLPTVIKMISDMTHNTPFWCAMLEVTNDTMARDENSIVVKNWKEVLLKLVNSYVPILQDDAKKKCIDVLKVFSSGN